MLVGAELLWFVALVGESIEQHQVRIVPHEVALVILLDLLEWRGHEALLIRSWQETRDGVVSKQGLEATHEGQRLLRVTGRLLLPHDLAFCELAREYLRACA